MAHCATAFVYAATYPAGDHFAVQALFITFYLLHLRPIINTAGFCLFHTLYIARADCMVIGVTCKQQVIKLVSARRETPCTQHGSILGSFSTGTPVIDT